MIIVWFRKDLRINDNKVLFDAINSKKPIVPIFIYEETGGASKWFMIEAVKSLKNDLKKYGYNLLFFKGNHIDVLQNIINKTKATDLYFHKRYDTEGKKVDDLVRKNIKIQIHEYKSYLICEPTEVSSSNGGMYKIFTPFSKAGIKKYDNNKQFFNDKIPKNIFAELEDLVKSEEIPAHPNWTKKFDWNVSEKFALSLIKKDFSDYENTRNIPSIEGTSKISAYLHYGILSVHRVYREIENERYRLELWWRDFAYHLLHQFPNMYTKPMLNNIDFSIFKYDEKLFAIWKNGETGKELVDAGMKQLWKTGWMHNRVRMVTASYLVKDLKIPWQFGERWFYDTLIDYDPAVNAMNWQWIAGCGADHMMFSRKFNPDLQAKKFDPDKKYIKEYKF